MNEFVFVSAYMRVSVSIYEMIERDFPGSDLTIEVNKLTIKKGYGLYYVVFLDGYNAMINRSYKPGILWSLFPGKSRAASEELDRIDQSISALLEEHGYRIGRMVESMNALLNW